MKAKKSLGQNFLENKNALKKMAAALAPRSGETIIEIGPGHGELTKELRTENSESRIIAIEKDGRLADLLKDFLKNDPNIEIITGDALKSIPEIAKHTKYQIRNTKYTVVGNIPYYITGHLLRVLSELEPKPRKIVLLTQKEVAERVCARPPKMNLLAASVQFWAEPKILMSVGRRDFHPAPKVDSAVLELLPRPRTAAEPEVIDGYYSLIRALFKQPRKTVLNNLATSDTRQATRSELTEKLERLGVRPNDRAQNLTIEDIKRLARGIKSGKNV